MKSVITLGEALVDFIPSNNKNIEFKMNPGGAPANVAVGVSRLGTKTYFVGKVGNDVLGQFLRKTLKENNVELDGMCLTDEVRTGLTFVTLDETGERDFNFYINPSADSFLKDEDINEKIFEQSKILHFGSISLIHEPARSATMYAVNLAKQKGMIVSYDPNLRINLWSDEKVAKERIISVMSQVDILKISEEELEFITGTSNIEEGVKCLKNKFNITLILVTLGSKGSYYFYKDNLELIPAMKVQTVDTTGAGDAFMSGILYNINDTDKNLNELDKDFLNYAVRFANISGALAASQKGAMSALPTLEKIKNIIEQ